MEPQKRHRFVSQFEYPPFDFQGGKAGRARSLTPKSNLLILELEDGESATVRGDIQLAPGFTCEEVLSEGDLIWISERLDDVRLLAPCLDRDFKQSGLFDQARSKQWQIFLERIRDFLKSRDFTEVRTPTLVVSPGLEPFLDPFKTEFKIGKDRHDFYLPTSPEFHLKKMLSLGWRKIFEFKECFRNGELSEHHQPEFLMLEWYRAYSGFDNLIQDVKEFFVFLQERFIHKKVFEKVHVTTMARLFEDHAGFELKPDSTREELLDVCSKSGIDTVASDGFDDLFARIVIEKIEPALAPGDPVIVRGYPPSQAALARIGADGWADRFEVYWRGFELANAFHELNDPREQRRRFQENATDKKRLGKEEVPVDLEFLAGLEHGMPPSAGIALGVERLFLAFIGERNLGAARAFPMRGNVPLE